MFRSRLIYRLEEQLEANINDPGFVYEALKVYLMLGGQAKSDAIGVVMPGCGSDWAETSFPAPATPTGARRSKSISGRCSTSTTGRSRPSSSTGR